MWFGILLVLIFLCPVYAEVDKVQIVDNGTSDQVEITNQSLNISSVSVNMLVSSGTADFRDKISVRSTGATGLIEVYNASVDAASSSFRTTSGNTSTFLPVLRWGRVSIEGSLSLAAANNKAPEDYVPALGYDIVKLVTGALSVPSNATVDDRAFLYVYENPAIKNFDYKQDKTVNFGLELWQAKGGDYVGVNN